MKNKTKSVLAAAAAWGVYLGLCGIGYGITKTLEKDLPPPVELVREVREYEVVGINPPKHFYVTLLDSKEHSLHSVFIGKHCNSWRNLGMNSKWSFLTVITQDSYGRVVRYIDGVSALCPR